LITAPTPRDDIRAELTVSGSSISAYIDGKRQDLSVTDGKIVLNIKAGNAVFLEV